MDPEGQPHMEDAEPATENSSGVPLKMYEIPGQDRITEHSFDRYARDKQRDGEIKHQAESQSTFKPDHIESLPPEERTEVISQGIDNPDPKIQHDVGKMLRYAPKDEIPKLEEKISKKIKKGLENPNIDVQLQATSMIGCVLYKKDELKKKVFKNIAIGLDNPDPKIRQKALKMISYAPLKKRLQLIKYGLEDPNANVRAEAADLATADLASFGAGIVSIFEPRVREKLKETIYEGIKRDLDDPDVQIQLNAAKRDLKYEFYLDYGYEVSKKVAENIERGLENSNFNIQKKAAEMILCVREGGTTFTTTQAAFRKKVAENIKRGLDSQDVEVRQMAAEMIRYAPNEEKEQLFQKAIEKGVANKLIEPPLYQGTNIDKKHFSKRKFEKTGSGTTLIGGELKDKAIMRHITPEAFLTWQKLFEDYKTWQDKDFDYVPVEPIISYRLNKNGQVDVASGVLDLSLDQWSRITSRFVEELRDQEQKILSVLDEQNISHGHTHEGNFCLRFFRKEDGSIDFDRVPRLYLIDFDQAVSPEK